MQVYLGDTPMDFRGIQLGDTNIQTVLMDKFLNLDYLVVGGGGAGQDGGGGAGGYVTGSVTVSSAVYQVVIGTGGIANTYPSSAPSPAQFGNPSAFTGSAFAFTALGGGRGGGGDTLPGVGGSGGGGGFSFQNGADGTPPQGFGGGAGGQASDGAAGGGGGAAEVGASHVGTVAGRGGNGKQWLDGNYYAGGGGGGTKNNSGTQPGGLGGGGNGSSEFVEASPGTPNTGGGGGGYWTSATPRNPKNGGSGVVIIRYPGGPQASGGTVTQSGGYTYHTFTSTSQFIVSNQSL